MISVVIPPKAAPLTIVAKGMDKSGTQTYTGSAAYQQVTGWTTRSGWASPTGDTLVATASGVVIISGSLNLNTGFLEKSVQVKKNGTIVYTSPKVFTSSPIPFTFHANVTAGDVFTMEMYCNINNEVVQTTNTFITLKEQVFALTSTATDDFNRANANVSGSGNWSDPVTLSRPAIVSNQAIGTGDAGCRSQYSASQVSASRPNTYARATIAGIGSGRVGLLYAGTTASGRPSSFAALTSTTNLDMGDNSSTSSSNAGTVEQSATVSAVTTPVEMLVMLTSATTADIFLGRAYVATHFYDQTGTYFGIYTRNATDIVDNFEQGTWT